jgi:hypothetical protein
MCHTTSITLAPVFAGLQQFPEGRGFKQWTGDDSKALMKVCTIILIFYIATVLIFLMRIYCPGLYTRYRRSCTQRDGPGFASVTRLHLHRLPQHHQL